VSEYERGVQEEQARIIALIYRDVCNGNGTGKCEHCNGTTSDQTSYLIDKIEGNDTFYGKYPTAPGAPGTTDE